MSYVLLRDVFGGSWLLNLPAKQMFLMPALLAMSIAATRMYRSLTDFCSEYGLLSSHSFSALTAIHVVIEYWSQTTT